MTHPSGKMAQGVHRSTLAGDAAVLGIAVVWGASYPVTKSALALAPVLVLIFYRFVATACVMGIAARRELVTTPWGNILRGSMLGAILAAIFIAEIAGLALTSATNAALIISLCTLFTPFLDYGLSRRLPPVTVVVGAVVACIGVSFLVGGLADWTLGDGLILLAAVLRAVMVVSTKRLMSARSLSSVALTAVQAATVGAVALVALAVTQDIGALAVRADASFWGSVAFLSLFCTIAAFYVQNAAVRRTSPTRVGFLMGTEPLFGFALAHLLLSEPVNGAAALGAVLIVAGTFTGLLADRGQVRCHKCP
ncbi:drug/metabolite transporter (DMT)-like permease [Neorhizobium huautlense]|uniref:Drug/metabolite transporter (DMT)-like permease n=1 Tax=Neorhizobium huautlense TaxID=67774 RepID=A0ABT9Q1Q8_9HYPH|nr:DMT family transporter [Neorhizobium huautlense]MDP9840380.1 drug/metabolite transporter (DMT)-like permease [Neorhizobium huautlense]